MLEALLLLRDIPVFLFEVGVEHIIWLLYVAGHTP